jgi:hypothetical protein
VKKKKKLKVGKIEIKETNKVFAIEDFSELLQQFEPSKPRFVFTSIIIEPFKNEEYAGLTIHWTCKGAGFGKVDIYISDGEIEMDTHYSNPEFIAALLTVAAYKILEMIEVTG